MSKSRQLDLFSVPKEPLAFEREHELRRRLPDHVRFGTSSWTFPGWAGLVYPKGTTQEDLLEHGLELYARCPLFRSVGIDRSYYAPLDRDTLARYAAELPPDFRCVMKMFSELTERGSSEDAGAEPQLLERGRGPRGGARAGAGHLCHPRRPSGVRDGAASALRALAPKALADGLHAFFSRLPKELSYAVELRNREHLTAEYLDVLREHGVAHVLSYWERMPEIGSSSTFRACSRRRSWSRAS